MADKQYKVRKGCEILHDGKPYREGRSFPADSVTPGILSSLEDVTPESEIDVEESPRFKELMRLKKEELIDVAHEHGLDVSDENEKAEISKMIIEVEVA